MTDRGASSPSSAADVLKVNNVGVSYDHARYLTEVDDDLVQRLITVNVTSLTEMTRIVLPGMVRRRAQC